MNNQQKPTERTLNRYSELVNRFPVYVRLIILLIFKIRLSVCQPLGFVIEMDWILNRFGGERAFHEGEIAATSLLKWIILRFPLLYK